MFQSFIYRQQWPIVLFFNIRRIMEHFGDILERYCLSDFYHFCTQN